MIFEKICFFIVILIIAIIIYIIGFLTGVTYEENEIKKKKINFDDFVIHHIPKTSVQLSASLHIPNGDDIYEDINKNILIGKLAKELPRFWRLEKEYSDHLQYTAYITIIPENNNNDELHR